MTSKKFTKRLQHLQNNNFMKKKILFLIIIVFIFSLGYIYTSQDEKEVDADLTVAELRLKHEAYLANSPFKKTLKMNKADRIANGIPPNKYYEREWELTMNPATGLPEPNKVLELQKSLRDRLVSARAPGDGAVGNDWVERGPNNVGGRTRVVLFDPTDGTK